MVWLTAISLLFIVTMAWYISQEVVVSIGSALLGDVTGEAAATRNLIEYSSIIWGPLFDGLIILWAIISSQRDDPTSRYM